MLLQDQEDGAKKPLGSYNRTLNAPGQNYETTHCDCVAIVWAIILLKPYLERETFNSVWTNDALNDIFKLGNLIGLLHGWRHCFSELDFDFVHRAGIKNKDADKLLRLETDETDKTVFEDDIRHLVMY